jgi:hypothetical protein
MPGFLEMTVASLVLFCLLAGRLPWKHRLRHQDAFLNLVEF